MELRYDVPRRADFFADVKAKYGHAVCGLCLNVCPHGRKGRKK